MDVRTLLADISRRFLKDRRVCRYRRKDLSDMSDDEIIQCCHWYCEESGQTDIFEAFRTKAESEYRYCGYLSEYIDDGLCYDIQMICAGYIKQSALKDCTVDAAAAEHCANCRYQII